VAIAACCNALVEIHRLLRTFPPHLTTQATIGHNVFTPGRVLLGLNVRRLYPRSGQTTMEEEFRAWLERQGHSPQTINEVWVTVDFAMRWFKAYGKPLVLATAEDLAVWTASRAGVALGWAGQASVCLWIEFLVERGCRDSPWPQIPAPLRLLRESTA
jgi:hypothetical protein